ncbi:MAG: hypothetical protein M3464_10110 [Chloroflexota bacterium]|nr:hypothetical protein [Chloroflexota bacterium]
MLFVSYSRRARHTLVGAMVAGGARPPRPERDDDQQRAEARLVQPSTGPSGYTRFPTINHRQPVPAFSDNGFSSHR